MSHSQRKAMMHDTIGCQQNEILIGTQRRTMIAKVVPCSVHCVHACQKASAMIRL